MSDNEERPKPPLYGSAGMAAAGMIPSARRKPVEEPTVEEEPEEVETELPEEPVESTVDEPVDAEPEEEEVEPPAPPEYTGKRAVVIGHGSEGGFADGLDTAFQRLDGVRLFALSDGNEETLDDSYTKAAAPEGFADFSEMLEKHSPDLACIAMPWTNRRSETVGASLESGAHVLIPLPLARTLKEADELSDKSTSTEKKIAVCGLLRCHPLVRRFHEERGELIGELLEIRLYGSSGTEVGGRDLLARGQSLFDLARWFAGEPEFVSATLLQGGYPAIAEDATDDPAYGLILGDEIHATFTMDSGVRVYFESDPALAIVNGSIGAEFIGSNGRARLWLEPFPRFSILSLLDPDNPNREDKWSSWPEEHAATDTIDHLSGTAADQRRVVLDWLDSIESGRDPECSGINALKALEMAHGVWQAGTTHRRAYFPLTNRLHPLSEETA